MSLRGANRFHYILFPFIVWGAFFLLSAHAEEPILPLPQTVELDARKVRLGEKLFHDKQLSSNNQVSCASCHDLKKGGTDNLQFSVGVSGKPGKLNTPTVFNSANNFAQFWDGRAETLEEQVDGPIGHPDEMASNWSDIVKKLNSDKVYRQAFLDIYRSPPTEKAIKDAIVTFEKSLITPNSRFDRYLRGEEELTPAEKTGYELFKSHGCASCHQGMNVGGNMFQTFGVIGDYFQDRGNITQSDLGRYNVTGEDWDKHVFKVPSLRNVELTAPYFHDGSAKTLEQAVDTMGKYQLGRVLTEEEKTALVTFLKSLTGEYKEYTK